MSTTRARLDVSPAAYEEIKKRLEMLGIAERIIQLEDKTVLDLDGIVLSRETDENVKVFILFQGKKI